MIIDELAWQRRLEEIIEPAVRDGRLLPIAPDDRLYVSVWTGTKSQEFVDAFRNVWNSIERPTRDRIVAFWITHAPSGKPQIEYSNCWRPAKDGIYATTAAFQGEMQFVAARVDPMPIDAKTFLIAHELAHVYQKARGDRPVPSPDSDAILFRSQAGILSTEEENEADADEIAASWGYPRGPLRDWQLKELVDQIMSASP